MTKNKNKGNSLRKKPVGVHRQASRTLLPASNGKVSFASKDDRYSVGIGTLTPLDKENNYKSTVYIVYFDPDPVEPYDREMIGVALDFAEAQGIVNNHVPKIYE